MVICYANNLLLETGSRQPQAERELQTPVMTSGWAQDENDKQSIV